MKTFTLLLALAVLPRMLLATIIHVPADSATIQSAINGASIGDTIVASPGVYGGVDYLGKSVTVASEMILYGDSTVVPTTIIDGNVHMSSRHDTASVLYGMTVLDGSVTTEYRAFAELVHCSINGNVLVGDGYGFSQCNIDRSTIIGTVHYTYGGGSYMTGSTVEGDVECWESPDRYFSNTIITGRIRGELDAVIFVDSCSIGSLDGGSYVLYYVSNSLVMGGIERGMHSYYELRNCTILDKLDLGSATVVLDSTILVVDTDAAVECTWSCGITARCSDVFGFIGDAWIDTNEAEVIIDTARVFFADPQFCYPAGGDYHISESSPCAPLNNDCDVLIGAFDIGCEAPYKCGDVNISGGVDIDDVVFLVNYVFLGGPAPTPIEMGDTDCSGFVDIDDIVYLIQYIFSGGYAPCDIDGDGIPDC